MQYPNDIWGPEPQGFADFKKNFDELPQYSTDVDFAKHNRRRDDGLVLDNWFLRGAYETKHLEIVPTDIFVTSFPKSGTTWLQEIVYAIISDLDYCGAKTTPLSERFPFMETAPISPMRLTKPRLIMTHLPYSDLPVDVFKNKPKILYICRNPKDTLVSYYHFYRIKKTLGFRGHLSEFFELFLNDKVNYAPYSRHILDFLKQKNNLNICFLKYEEIQKDTINQLKRIAEFLGKRLTDEQAIQVANHCSFNNMATTSTMNYQNLFDSNFYDASKGTFLRKGKIGDWKNYFNEEMNKRMENWIETKFGSSGFKFEYE